MAMFRQYSNTTRFIGSSLRHCNQKLILQTISPQQFSHHYSVLRPIQKSSKMQELVVYGKPTYAGFVREAEIPKPGPKDVLIKVAYTGLNPKDWKFTKNRDQSAALNVGDDVSGTSSKLWGLKCLNTSRATVLRDFIECSNLMALMRSIQLSRRQPLSPCPLIFPSNQARGFPYLS